MIELGDIIELTEDQKKVIKAIKEKMEISELAFNAAAFNMMRHRKELWNLIHSFHPEIENFQATYEPKYGILITGNKEEL